MDCDGVLTDGKIYFLPNPAGGDWIETKGFDCQDGIALTWLHWKGIKTGIISGRKSPAVELRAEQGHMTYCYQGHIEKIPLLEEILRDSGLKPDEVGYIGDDLTDVVIFRRVGWAVAVGNARNEVKQAAPLRHQGCGRGRGTARGGGGDFEDAGILGRDPGEVRDWWRGGLAQCCPVDRERGFLDRRFFRLPGGRAPAREGDSADAGKPAGWICPQRSCCREILWLSFQDGTSGPYRPIRALYE